MCSAKFKQKHKTPVAKFDTHSVCQGWFPKNLFPGPQIANLVSGTTQQRLGALIGRVFAGCFAEIFQTLGAILSIFGLVGFGCVSRLFPTGMSQ